MKGAITSALIDLLRAHRVESGTHGQERWKVGDVLAFGPGARIEGYSHVFSGFALPLALGAFSYSFSALDPAMEIGRYSSISWSVSAMGSKHPQEWASTSPFSHNPRPLGGILKYLEDREVPRFTAHAFDQGDQSIRIGHDVWIGADVLLKRGITIGDGAIVGARSVVTRDVPPYAVVAGTPARVLRPRFPAAIVERMMRAQWWRFGPDLLQPLDVRMPEAFLEQVEALGDGQRLVAPVLTGAVMEAAMRAA